MAAISENSFGAKLRRVQDLVTCTQSFVGYAPPRQQETVASMNALIASINTANTSAASSYQQYKTSVDSRQKAFKGTTTSIDKQITQIRGAIESQFGKTSIEATSIKAIINRMRATKLIKTPVNPETASQEKTISQSERSYGSLTQGFSDLISSLQQFSGYNPSNTTLRIAGLQATSTQLTTLNNGIIQRLQGYKTSLNNRNALYIDLKDRAQRIKSYVKSQYGQASNEYKMIKGIRI